MNLRSSGVLGSVGQELVINNERCITSQKSEVFFCNPVFLKSDNNSGIKGHLGKELHLACLPAYQSQFTAKNVWDKL